MQQLQQRRSMYCAATAQEAQNTPGAAPLDLTGFVAANAPADSAQSLALLLSSVAVAVKQIAGKVSRAGLEGLFGVAEQQGGGSGDTQKKLDVVAVSRQMKQECKDSLLNVLPCLIVTVWALSMWCCQPHECWLGDPTDWLAATQCT